VLSGLARLAGYLYGVIVRESRQIPYEVARYVRNEQIGRLLGCMGLGGRAWKPNQPDGIGTGLPCVE